MKKLSIKLLVAVLGLASSAAMAQASPWLVRARAVHIDTANKSDPVGGVGAANLIRIESKTIPELDVSYFLTPNIAAELILTYPQKHDVTLDGAKIGSFKHLPPTLTLQYHFAPEQTFNPYVGAGLNYTRISQVRLLNGAGDLENDSWGGALQAGFDVKLDRNWSLNVDVKKVQIRSDVYVGGARASKVKVDPVLFGIGVGYRF
ncbi:OmpW/AlkL family protein [Massilia brevitalea]|uniref:OmpW/AlkL family protein n=1 Tax=Massilia brevitalea TaxID=442526 RepID=UPI0027393ED0|nr:OmpW family outer membrane protein [Massilia brevitalea]